MTIYRLTDIDAATHEHFTTLEKAKAAGDRSLGDDRPWTEHARNFSAESQRGWQMTGGQVVLAIIPIEVA